MSRLMTTPPEIFQALADATRWEIVRLLAEGPRCVCELTAALAVPQSTLSTHLQVLRSSGLLIAERRGRWMYYGISRQSRPLLRALWKHFPAAVPATPRTGFREACCDATASPALISLTAPLP